mmetsp:Transcript_1127/g.7320  ORF Transcript_1127/g.7320 Transcript_1127/m.7320 type:complete len:430 (-) Transcript_1127:1314-2603(-)
MTPRGTGVCWVIDIEDGRTVVQTIHRSRPGGSGSDVHHALHRSCHRRATDAHSLAINRNAQCPGFRSPSSCLLLDRAVQPRSWPTDSLAEGRLRVVVRGRSCSVRGHSTFQRCGLNTKSRNGDTCDGHGGTRRPASDASSDALPREREAAATARAHAAVATRLGSERSRALAFAGKRISRARGRCGAVHGRKRQEQPSMDAGGVRETFGRRRTRWKGVRASLCGAPPCDGWRSRSAGPPRRAVRLAWIRGGVCGLASSWFACVGPLQRSAVAIVAHGRCQTVPLRHRLRPHATARLHAAASRGGPRTCRRDRRELGRHARVAVGRSRRTCAMCSTHDWRAVLRLGSGTRSVACQSGELAPWKRTQRVRCGREGFGKGHVRRCSGEGGVEPDSTWAVDACRRTAELASDRTKATAGVERRIGSEMPHCWP